MTQQQKQRELPKQASRTVGEIVIATLDLLLNVPILLGWLSEVHSKFSSFRHGMGLQPDNLLLAVAILLASIGFVPAGLLILFRQQRSALIFQWLVSLAVIFWLIGMSYSIAIEKIRLEPLSQISDLIYLCFLVLGGTALFLLPLWLRKMEKD